MWRPTSVHDGMLTIPQLQRQSIQYNIKCLQHCWWSQVINNVACIVYYRQVICYVAYILCCSKVIHYYDVIMSSIASQITSLTIVYSTVYSDAEQRKHQRSASLAFVWGIHRWPVNSPHKGPVTRKMFPFDDVIMSNIAHILCCFVKIHSIYIQGCYCWTLFARVYWSLSCLVLFKKHRIFVFP